MLIPTLTRLAEMERAATPGPWYYHRLEIHANARMKVENPAVARLEVLDSPTYDPYATQSICTCGFAMTRGEYHAEEVAVLSEETGRQLIDDLLNRWPEGVE